ncbi:prepilin-type N-terminal cleavage/methylation domain-containing protein [Campylobacter hominis]|uniref:N-methylation n=1 Tax=Campylobacter hominis (strain ATCC BAA-381 / DSM 21671 / CCUG 45161 / LMG 19568 / NCTC 13146 / CH001A) TaxID=360107 RepID=A7I343_CAMHC|nr:prepilin-type N-terminal cleavage/methylation domain-containing protein [Campylobacter hominis]ABS52279.1 N- methylation [Campylobacter hominis ATCC BAA-381]SUW85444.1 N- methylation [Campylobacter hominis]
MKKAFTMIELIFVIVVLGILAGIAVPRLAATRDDATIAKMRGDLASIRSGISLKRSQNMMRGNIGWPELGANFSNVVQGGIKAGNDKNGWTQDAQNANSFKGCVAAGKCANFTYDTTNGNITCTGTACDMLGY